MGQMEATVVNDFKRLVEERRLQQAQNACIKYTIDEAYQGYSCKTNKINTRRISVGILTSIQAFSEKSKIAYSLRMLISFLNISSLQACSASYLTQGCAIFF